MSRRQWVWASVIAVLLSTLLMSPYILGHTLARPGTFYTGLVMNPEDAQSYFAKIRQGYEGRWLYTIPFTPEPHEPAFLGGFYIALGHIARILNAPLLLAWHVSRFVSDIFLFLMTFAFVGMFLKDNSFRWTAFALAITGSGLGWLLFILGQPYWLGAFPVDFKMPEAHLFFTALTSPHVAFGTGILLLSFWLILKSTSANNRSFLYALLAGCTNLILGVVYPFLILLPAVSVGLYWAVDYLRNRCFQWQQAVKYTIPFLLPLPLFLYYAYTYQVNDVMRQWAAQAITQSPPWPHYLVAFGVMLVLGILPYISRIRSSILDGPAAFLWSWIAASALLVYAPINPQRRFVQGLQVPLAILATLGLFTYVLPRLEETACYRRILASPRYSKAGLRRLIIFAFLTFISLSNLYLLSDVTITAALRQPYPFFRSQAEANAVAWLQDNANPIEVVLCGYETGNFVAASTSNRVTLGHWAETVDVDRKRLEIARFFDSKTDDEWRQSLLDQYDVSYVWYGIEERALGSFLPEHADYLRAVYAGDSVTVYTVLNE